MEDNISWRVIPDIGLQTKTWGEETIVFHGGSAETHCLSSLGIEILQIIDKEGPVSAIELAGLCSSQLDIEKDEELLNLVKSSLNKFKRLCLIEPQE